MASKSLMTANPTALYNLYSQHPVVQAPSFPPFLTFLSSDHCLHRPFTFQNSRILVDTFLLVVHLFLLRVICFAGQHFKPKFTIFYAYRDGFPRIHSFTLRPRASFYSAHILLLC